MSLGWPPSIAQLNAIAVVIIRQEFIFARHWITSSQAAGKAQHRPKWLPITASFRKRNYIP
jgi:hypothetical protein